MTSTNTTTQAPIKLQPPKWSKVKDLERGTHGYNVKVAVISLESEVLPHSGDKKTTLIKAQVGDETGKADLLLRTENPDIIKVGKVIAIRNGRRQIVKGHISLQLDIFGRITEEKDDIKATGELNISEKELPRREKRERREGEDRRDRGERREGGERRERREGGERRERTERGDRVERGERGDRAERGERRRY